jgi:hypothetical protein
VENLLGLSDKMKRLNLLDKVNIALSPLGIGAWYYLCVIGAVPMWICALGVLLVAGSAITCLMKVRS